MIRIGWLSPLTPKSGVGTFTHAISQHFPAEFDGEEIDSTLIFTPDDVLYPSDKRTIQAQSWDGFENILGLFDIVFYNIGNNSQHHEEIFRLARRVPGVIIFHDYVYQHYVADQCVNRVKSVPSFSALLLKFGSRSALRMLRNSRITSRLERPIYSPWDTEYASKVPLSSPFAKMGSAAIVHSKFAEDEVRKHFTGPILRLGMPFDQKETVSLEDTKLWAERMAGVSQLKALFFGHINSTKSLDLVLEAIADSDYLRRHLKLTIAGFAGPEDYLDRLNGLISTHRLESIVTFELNVSDSRLRDLSNSTDIFINLRFPNTEGASVSLVEQMVVGKPVLVYNTGCYAEIPDDAALKVDTVGSSEAIRLTLEQELADKIKLIAIGKKAREHVSRLDCDTYVHEVMGFVTEHRQLLQDRTKLGSVQRTAFPKEQAVCDEPFEWLMGLAEARLSFDLLDKGLLPVDPSLIFELSAEELAGYVAISIIGAPTADRLVQALLKHFDSVSRGLAYADITYLHLLASAIFDGDPGALRRLRELSPVRRTDLWEILRELPPKVFHQAAALMLTGRLLDAIAVNEVEHAIERGLPVELLLEARSGFSDGIPLGRAGFSDLEWLATAPLGCSFDYDTVADGVLDFEAHEQVLLVGAHGKETEGGVWTRGTTSFVVLGAQPGQTVNIALQGVATDIGPRKVRIQEVGGGTDLIETIILADEVQTVAIKAKGHPAAADGNAVSAIAIQVDRSFRPCDIGLGDDPRELGVHLISIEIAPTQSADAAEEPSTAYA